MLYYYINFYFKFILMSLSIIVLAAGKGSRMLSKMPKVFHEVGNYPMLFHVLDTASSLQKSSINLVISKSLSVYKDLLKKKYKNLSFTIQFEQKGTADAVNSAIKFINKKKLGTTLVMYGDTPLISKKTLSNALKKFKEKKLDLCVISMKPPRKKNSYGKLRFLNKKLIGIIEQSELNDNSSESDICNSGIMIFRDEPLIQNIKLVKNKNNKNEYYLTDLVEIFNKKNLLVDHYTCSFTETLGVNSMIDLAEVNNEFQKERRNYFLNRGVFMQAPETVYFSFDTRIGSNVTIQPNVFLGPSVEIKNDVIIKSFSYLDNVKVHDLVTIGPFARIRDGVEIKDEAKIGNFVELKKSSIGKNVKISHLSYAGDSIINENSNIGAGAITCNYDGVKKNKTIIGENCFIGSNTSLVAPLKIKKGSIIGAGTVVNQDIPIETVVYRKSELIKKNKKK